ncbi:DUF742 domain-containing protein [Pseudonocardia sp. MH-G8]|uniref:DUF742 domain-containing protein n=1 Tax=Pseudonocardia sp. MH-G8 TaxID=1854588 RepID=UPI001304287B|nr:DUF742 domain-containing protein [Pseudonocardia sp. MH-G8]
MGRSVRGVTRPAAAVARGSERSVVPGSAPPGWRSRPGGGELALESVVTATRRAGWGHDLGNAHRTVLELARAPVSLVEIAATLAVPPAEARLLMVDLVTGGYLDLHVPPPTIGDGPPGPEILIRLLEGLRSRRRPPSPENGPWITDAPAADLVPTPRTVHPVARAQPASASRTCSP